MGGKGFCAISSYCTERFCAIRPCKKQYEIRHPPFVIFFYKIPFHLLNDGFPKVLFFILLPGVLCVPYLNPLLVDLGVHCRLCNAHLNTNSRAYLIVLYL